MSERPRRLLTREEILAVNDLRVAAVDIPERRITIRLRTLTGSEWWQLEHRLAFVAGPDFGVNPMELRAALIAAAVVEDDHASFVDALLAGVSEASIDRLFTVAVGLMGHLAERLTRPWTHNDRRA